MPEEKPKLSADDPAYITLVKAVETLSPFDRKTQLKILCEVCLRLDMLNYARWFLDALESENG